MTSRFYIGLFLWLVLPTSAHAQSPHPDSAHIITTDLAHFWDAFDRAAPTFEAQAFQELYLDRGSAGVNGFTPYRIVGAAELAETVRTHVTYYAAIRPLLTRIPEMERSIRASFYALKYLYPDAVFPDVYFVIGRMNSAGTLSPEALLIGAEMFGRHEDVPTHELSPWQRTVIQAIEKIPHTVAHELIHYQQHYPTISNALLDQAIKEGRADFLAELISGTHGNEHIHAWANPREDELWQAFQAAMHGTDTSAWLYNGDRAKDRPADLGYWMGYKICEAYYLHAPDKRQAIQDILSIQDFEDFLARSTYVDTF